MTRPFYAYLLAILVAPFLSGQTQITPQEVIQTGFAVVTPVSGGGAGLAVTETFSEQVGGALFQATVLPSPLATITSVVVTTNPATGANTGVAIVNPNDSTATITLSLRDQGGNTLSTRTITVAGRQQIPRFVTELFSGTPELATPFTGSLVVNADLAIGVLGLQFVGPSFTALPTSVQLAGVTTFAAGNVTTPTAIITGVPGAITPTTAITPTITIPSTPTVPISTVPIPSTIPVTTIPSTTIPATTVPATVTVSPQVFAIGTTSQSPAAFGTPVSNTTITGQPPNTLVTAAAGVVGLGAFLLPQVATGGGWESQVTVANTSGNTQIVRVEFFNANGGPLIIPIGSTISGVAIPPGGVVTFPTGP
jgi:hypothetical protein